MGGNIVAWNYDATNMETIVSIHNDSMVKLSDAREFICSELAKMRQLVKSDVVVTPIDGRKMEFRLGISNTVRDIPGAFEWVTDLIAMVQDN